MRRLLSSLLFLWLAVPARAHDGDSPPTYRFERYTVNEGLASSTVFDIAQDRDGVIWVGTELGLCRFNGTHFRNYGVLDGLPGNAVYELDVDSAGRVWMATFSHIGYWASGRFVQVRLEGYRGTSRLLSLTGGDDGRYWTYGGGRLWSGNDSLWTATLVDEHPVSASFYTVSDVRGDSVWLRSGYLLQVLVGDSLHTLLESPEYMSRSFFVTDPRGGRYLVSNVGIWKESPRGWEPALPNLARFLAGSAHPASIRIDDLGNWWIGTFENGLWYLDRSLQNDSEPVLYLADETVTAIFEDRDRNLWIGTESSGLLLLSYRARRVGNLREAVPGALREAFREQVVGTDGVHWIFRPDREGTYLAARHPDGDSAIVKGLGRVYELEALSGGAVMAGTSKGLYRLDWSGVRVFQTFVDAPPAERGEACDRLFRQHAVPTRTLWYDTLSGLTYAYSMAGMQRINADGRIDTLVPNGPHHNLLISDVEGVPGTGRVWWSSYGRGLYLWQGDSLQRFGTEFGLNSSSLIGLWLDDDGDVWTIGSNGVNRIRDFDPVTGKARVFSLYENDGLIMGEVRDGLLWRDTVWLRTNAGLTYFPRDLIVRQPVSSPGIELERVVIAGLDTVPLAEYRLGHRQNDVELEFGAVAFSDSRQIRYRYRVEGLDGEWQESAFGEIRLRQLPPGEYRVWVVAVDVYGMESPRPLQLSFILQPAWWQRPLTRWSGGLLLLLVTGGAGARFARQRARQREKRLILEKQLAETEQKALRAQMNPHFIYNVLNSIQQFVLREDTEAALDYLAEFGDLIRRSFENSRRLAIPLSDELRFLGTYLRLEKMRFQEDLDYALHVPDEIDPDKTFVPSLLIQPFVENSIRHGLRHRKGGGRIDVRFRRDGDRLLCRIEDNGVGIDEDVARAAWMAEDHRATGMAITRNRLEVFNRMSDRNVGMEVTNLRSEGITGTRVVLTIPLWDSDPTRVPHERNAPAPVGDRGRRAPKPGFSA
jgi:ligand-binding sensor domain-containing protein/signal transduction histidine kinase